MRKLSPRGQRCFKCLILMLSGPVELFLLFFNCLLEFRELYMSGVKFAYVSVEYSVCFACCVFDGVGGSKDTAFQQSGQHPTMGCNLYQPFLPYHILTITISHHHMLTINISHHHILSDSPSHIHNIHTYIILQLKC